MSLGDATRPRVAVLYDKPDLVYGPPVPSARIPPLVDVAWRDSPDRPWRYGGTGLSRRPADGPEVVEVYEPATGETHRFEDDDIDRLHVKPLPTGKPSNPTARRLG